MGEPVRQRTRHRRRRVHPGHLLVAPYALLLVAFGIGPGIYALLLTFTQVRGGLPDLTTFGLQNYRRAFSDFRFVQTFQNLGEYLLYSVPAAVVIVVLLALMLESKRSRYHSFLRTVYFVPAAVAGVPAILLAIIMFDPRLSPFGPLLGALGFEQPSEVLAAGNLARLFTIVALYTMVGLWVAIFYGALSSIPPTVADAASVDGARPWQISWYVKRPYLHPYIIYMLILVIAANVQLFAEPELFASAQIAPIPSTWSPNQLAYEFAFGRADLGAAAVMSLLMLLIGVAAAALVLRLTNFFRIDD